MLSTSYSKTGHSNSDTTHNKNTFPFYNQRSFKQLGFELPDVIRTASALTPFRFGYSPISPELAAYNKFYGFDRLHARHYQGYVMSGSERIHVQYFQPIAQTNTLTPSKGTVWLMHGYMEHCGIMQPMVERLLAQQVSVVLLDLIGHGLSSGDRGQVDHFDAYQLMLKSVIRTLQKDAEHYPESDFLPQPWLGMGQSTGAAIWMQHVLTAEHLDINPYVQRLMLLSPLVRPARSRWWQHEFLMNQIKPWIPSLPRVFKLNNRHPEFLRFVKEDDPLTIRIVGLRWVSSLIPWIKKMQALPACDFPVWVIQGEQDETVNFQYNISFIRRKFKLNVLLLLEQCAHQLTNERDDLRAPIDRLVEQFINTH